MNFEDELRGSCKGKLISKVIECLSEKIEQLCVKRF
jgi:hypothetical protein